MLRDFKSYAINVVMTGDLELVDQLFQHPHVYYLNLFVPAVMSNNIEVVQYIWDRRHLFYRACYMGEIRESRPEHLLDIALFAINSKEMADFICGLFCEHRDLYEEDLDEIICDLHRRKLYHIIRRIQS